MCRSRGSRGQRDVRSRSGEGPQGGGGGLTISIHFTFGSSTIEMVLDIF